jgi:predicted transcriptional regulator
MSEQKIEYANQWLKYELSPEEMQETASHLAEKTQELGELEDQKKSVMSSFKEKIDTCQSEINRAARLYKDGYEMRDIECMVECDYTAGEVRYVRTDSGEVARVKKMTVAERQKTIDDFITDPTTPEAA